MKPEIGIRLLTSEIGLTELSFVIHTNEPHSNSSYYLPSMFWYYWYNQRQ